MRISRVSRLATVAIAGAATAAMLSLPAAASTFNVSQQTSGGGSAIFGGNGHDTVRITAPGNIGNVYAGAFALNATELGGDFVAWCLDIFNNVALPDTYQTTTSPFSDRTLSATARTDIKSLFDVSYSGLDLSSDDDSAGFQIALWEIAFEGAGNSYDVTLGDFAVSNAAGAIAAANGYLTNLGGSATGNFNLIFLESVDGNQDLITVAPVPVPASGLMLMGALGGLTFLRRRRRAAEA